MYILLFLRPLLPIHFSLFSSLDTAVYVEAGPAMEHILAVVEISSNEEGNHGAATLVKQTGDIKDTKETVIDEGNIP